MLMVTNRNDKDMDSPILRGKVADGGETLRGTQGEKISGDMEKGLERVTKRD